MKETGLALLFSLFFVITYAQFEDTVQEARQEDIVSLNLNGDASIVSIGFEKLFFLGQRFALNGRIGMGFNTNFSLSASVPDYVYLTIPHHITANYGKKRSFLEFGMGGTLINGETDQNYLFYPKLGYRRLPAENRRICFRVWLYYPLTREIEDLLLVPFGLSIGIAL